MFYVTYLAPSCVIVSQYVDLQLVLNIEGLAGDLFHLAIVNEPLQNGH